MQALYELGAFYSSIFWLLSRIRPTPPWLPSSFHLALEHSVSSVSDCLCMLRSRIADSLPCAAAFNSSFGHNDLIPTSVEVHTSRSYHPSPAVRALEDSTHQGDMSERVVRISTVVGLDLDTEAYASPSSSPGATRGHSITPFDGHHNVTLSSASPQPYQISAQTPPRAQQGPREPLRRENILSYSNPVWATFGAPPDEGSRASIHSETSVDIMRSPTSNGHSHERSTKFLSATSTILGSDIIRRTTLSKGKDRMRNRYSISNLPLSSTSSVPSSSRRAVHYSWLSKAPACSTTCEDTSQEGSTLPKGASQRSTSLLSSKSKHGSKSSRSSKSRKSSNSTRSTKITGFKLMEAPSAWIGSSMDRASLARPPRSLPRDRVGFVRGPRPPPSPL